MELINIEKTKIDYLLNSLENSQKKSESFNKKWTYFNALFTVSNFVILIWQIIAN